MRISIKSVYATGAVAVFLFTCPKVEAQPACVRHAPTVSVPASSRALKTSHVMRTVVSVRNNDSPECAPVDMRIMLTGPWGSAISPKDQSINAGKSGNFDLDILVPIDTQPGAYQAKLIAVPFFMDSANPETAISIPLQVEKDQPVSGKRLTGTPQQRLAMLDELAQRCFNVSTDGIPTLATALSDPSPEVRKAAAHNIQLVGTKWRQPKMLYDAGTVKVFRQALSAKEPEIQVVAMSALGGIGEAANGAIPEIRSKLKDPNPTVRASAYLALGALTKDQADFLPAFLQGMKDPHPDCRVSAINAVGDNKKAGASEAVAISGLFKDEILNVRKSAVQAVDRLHIPDDRLVLPAISALEDKDRDIRMASANILGGVLLLTKNRSYDQSALAALQKVERDSDPTVQNVIRQAIRNIEGARQAS